MLDLDILVGQRPVHDRDADKVESSERHPDPGEHRVEGEHGRPIDDDQEQADQCGRQRPGDQVGHRRVAVDPAGDFTGVPLLVEGRRQPQHVPHKPRRLRRSQRLLEALQPR